MKQWHKCIIDELSSLLHKNFVNFESLFVFLLEMMAPKSHILSACVTRDSYQNSILSSLHAKHSHSVAADSGPVTLQDHSQNFPRGVKPSGWRVTVYNAGFSPFHALILSIVPEHSQLPMHRPSKDHVTLPHPLFAERPASLPPPCFTVFSPVF